MVASPVPDCGGEGMGSTSDMSFSIGFPNRICATQNTLYGAAEPCLLGHQAVTICAVSGVCTTWMSIALTSSWPSKTSAYLGPCTVSYRIGVVHGKYAHGMAEHELHNSAIQWQPLSMCVPREGMLVIEEMV